VKRKATRDQKNRVDRSEQDGQMRIAVWRPDIIFLPRESVLRPAQEDVGGDEGSKKHALGNEEHDHAELRRSRARGGVFGMGVVCGGSGGHE